MALVSQTMEAQACRFEINFILTFAAMRTGKDLILITKEFTSEVKWKSWFYLLSTLLIVFALFVGTLSPVHLSVRLVLSILTGLVLVRLFVIYHDYEHHSILHRSATASVIFKIFGLFILAPESIWKRSHDYHHAHNSKLFSASIGSFPIYTKEKFMSASKLERFGYLAIRHPLNIAMGYLTMFVFGMCVQSFVSNPRKHYDSLLSLLVHFGLATAIYFMFGGMAVLLSVLLPCTLAFALGGYLFYAQHNFPGVTFKINTEWTYEHAAVASSSYMKMNPFMQWMTANIGFHHIHHMNARIPFYRLPEAMKAIPELQDPTVTSLSPIDIYRCLRLKVWDNDAKQLVPLSAIR